MIKRTVSNNNKPLDEGRDVNEAYALLQIPDKDGNTPLHRAVKENKLQVIESIMNETPAELLPALLQIQGKYGYTVLHLAAVQNQFELIELIINKTPADSLPALLQIQNKLSGNTVLHWAAQKNQLKLIELIIDKTPADSLSDLLQIQGEDGTVLHWVAMQKELQLIELIINKIPTDSLPAFLSELSTVAIRANSATSLNTLEESLNYTIYSKVKFFNINSISVDGERIIDIAQKLYVHTQRPSVLKLINDLRIAGSVEPKAKVQFEKAEENINLAKLDSVDRVNDPSRKNYEITRKVLTKLDGYNLSEAQINDNIHWFKQKDFDGWENTSWGWGGNIGVHFTVPEIIDILSGMRNVNDRLGVNWDFKKVLATIIHIASISDDKFMVDNLIGTLSELKMCDLGKLMNLVSVAQSKFIRDMEASQKPIEYSDDEKYFLFQNALNGLKNALDHDKNKIAEAVKTWLFELTDDAVARKTPEKWSPNTIKIHGLFNSGLIELINDKNLNCDSSHFIFLREGVIELRIKNNIQSPKEDVQDKIIKEWYKLYIHSKNLYFQQAFDNIAKSPEAPEAMEEAFGNFTFSHQSYYGNLKGIDLNVFAKFYKKLLDKGNEYAEQLIKIVTEYGFLDSKQISEVLLKAEDPNLVDYEVAASMQVSAAEERIEEAEDARAVGLVGNDDSTDGPFFWD